jgi:hypothetical protein
LAFVGWLAALGVLAAACSERPAEPEQGERSARATVAPLVYTVPATWTQTVDEPRSARRAAYRVPKTGGDTEDGELLVLFYGTGSNGDRDKSWDEWFKQFDGDPKATAQRKSFQASGMEVETFDFTGTYKLNMGPQRRGMKTSPVQMVKNDYRMIGAVVHTTDRGNWFFRLVGPKDTVASHEAEMRALLESVK